MNSLEDSERIVLKNACKFNQRHAIHRAILWRVNSLEYFFCQGNHLLNWNVDPIANPIVEGIQNVKVHNDDVSVLRFFVLKFSIFAEKEN